jgi:hypothetical protein
MIIPIIVIVVLGFIALSMALGSENKTKSDYEKSKAEREKAELEREQASREHETSLVVAATERGVLLESLRQEAEQRILIADQTSLANVFTKIEEQGGLQVTFGTDHQADGKARAKVAWAWNPFGNAVLKIYRNRQSIIEDPKAVVEQCDLIFIDNKKAEGEYIDGDSSAGNTFNYYVFLEVRHIGFKPAAVTRDIPSEIGQGVVLDNYGNEVKIFKTVEPEEYEESVFFGFHAQRITIEAEIDELVGQRKQLDKRRDRVALKKYAAKIAAMEEEMEIEESGLNADTLATLLDRAKAKSAQRKSFEELISNIEDDPDLDTEEKEELVAELLDRFQ